MTTGDDEEASAESSRATGKKPVRRLTSTMEGTTGAGRARSANGNLRDDPAETRGPARLKNRAAGTDPQVAATSS
jgi:hypothetical protein